MRKIVTALLLIGLGAGLAFFAFSAHVVRTSSGHIVVWKTKYSLADVYVDIRSWKPADWKSHDELTSALKKSGRAELIPKSPPKSLPTNVGSNSIPRR